jgi:hypothetical protein
LAQTITSDFLEGRLFIAYSTEMGASRSWVLVTSSVANRVGEIHTSVLQWFGAAEKSLSALL